VVAAGAADLRPEVVSARPASTIGPMRALMLRHNHPRHFCPQILTGLRLLRSQMDCKLGRSVNYQIKFFVFENCDKCYFDCLMRFKLSQELYETQIPFGV
jgi:hypothetical protein